MAYKNEVRIISGKWRGRKLRFKDQEGLRPTSDRIRETLFNWLIYDIESTRCLDLFTGTGALGAEALSRGASEVVFVDSNSKNCESLLEQLNSLGSSSHQVLNENAFDFIKRGKNFDLVFLDPPFGKVDKKELIGALNQSKICSSSTMVYFESNEALSESDLPNDWTIKKNKQAGKVFYYLIACGN